MRETKRRKMGYWEPFNVWWREYVAQHDKRPKVHEMKKWYETNAERVWGGTGPTWDETKKHSKGMRRIEDISDYFRQYRRGRRKKAAGCSIDSDTTSSDGEELMEGASTPDSQAKPPRKGPGGSGCRGRGRPRQDAGAASTAVELGAPFQDPDQPTRSGSSSQFPALGHLQQPLACGAQPPDHHNMQLGLAQPMGVQLPPDEKEDLPHLQQQHHPQQQQLLQQQLLQQQRQQEKQHYLQMASNGGAPQFPPTPAAQAHQQQRASSSSFLNAVCQLRTASTSEVPMRLGSAVMPSVPAPPPAQQPAQGQALMAMAPPPPPQVPQVHMQQPQPQQPPQPQPQPQPPHWQYQQTQDQHHNSGPAQQQHQYSQPKLDEPEPQFEEHPHLPHPNGYGGGGRHYSLQHQQQPPSPPQEYGEAGSPPDAHTMNGAVPHNHHHQYPTLFGVPVPGLPFFGAWRSRSGAMPPGHPHGHPAHPPPHQPYPGHPPPPYMQRSLTMPRVWSQPPGGAAPPPQPPPMQRRMAPWGMGAMSRMLSMPRSMHGGPPQQQQMQQQQMQQQQMPPPMQQQQHPPVPGAMHQPPLLQQPQQQRPAQTPFAIRAGNAIFGSFRRGGSQSPPMSPPTDPYMDSSVPPPPPQQHGLPQPDPYMTASPPATAPPPPSMSPPHPYSAASPPQSASPESFASQQQHHHQHQHGGMSMAPGAPPQQPAALPMVPYMNGHVQPPSQPQSQPLQALHQNQAMPYPQAVQQPQQQQQSQSQQQPFTMPQPQPQQVPAPTSLDQAPAPAAVSAQQAVLPPGPPPEPFRTRTRVISLPRSYELPDDPDLHRHLHMGPPAQPQEAGAATQGGVAPGGFMAALQEAGCGGAGCGVAPDLAPILENGSGEGQALLADGERQRHPSADAQVASPQSSTEPHSSGSGSGLIGRLFTRGSTMQRLRELFWSWASPEAEGGTGAHEHAASASAGGSGSTGGSGGSAGGSGGSAEGSDQAVAAPVAAPGISPLLWGRSNSNTRSAGSPRLPPPGSPDQGPNPFKQQLQRLGSMSSSWLLGKRSREEGSPATQTSTPTSRKLQRGISGVFRPFVDMMSFGRRSGTLSGAGAIAAAAAAAVAEVEAEQAAAAAAAPAADDTVMQCTEGGPVEHGIVASAAGIVLPAADVGVGAAAAAIAPGAGGGGGDGGAAGDDLPLPHLMSCNTDVDGERLLLEALDSHFLAAYNEDASVVRQQTQPQPPLPTSLGVVPAGAAAVQPYDSRMSQAPLGPMAAPPVCGAATFMQPQQPPQQPQGPLQHQPPSATNGGVRGPVITTGAPVPPGSRGAGAAAAAAPTRPQQQSQPQQPFNGYGGHQAGMQPLPQQDATATAGVWLPGEAPVQAQPMQVCGLQQQQPQVPLEDGGSNGGMLLRLSNSLTDYLKQALWGR